MQGRAATVATLTPTKKAITFAHHVITVKAVNYNPHSKIITKLQKDICWNILDIIDVFLLKFSSLSAGVCSVVPLVSTKSRNTTLFISGQPTISPPKDIPPTDDRSDEVLFVKEKKRRE